MSGESLDYAYLKVQEIALDVSKNTRTALHRAFATHLAKCAVALHDLEWVLSSDYGEGREIEAINAVLSPSAELEQVVEEAKLIKETLVRILDNMDYLCKKI